ncbi:MAG: hypothetical protein AAF672_09775, partial [Pseudomonadota bacterium]
MSVPPHRSQSGPSARHSKVFLSRLDAARARRAESLKLRGSAEAAPPSARLVLQAPVNKPASEMPSEAPVMATPHAAYAAMHRLGLTVSQIAALVLAFLRVRVEAAAALPLVRREDIKLLWAVPV